MVSIALCMLLAAESMAPGDGSWGPPRDAGPEEAGAVDGGCTREPWCQGTVLHTCDRLPVDCALADPTPGGVCGIGPEGQAECILPVGANCLAGSRPERPPWPCQGTDPGCIETRTAVACVESAGTCAPADIGTCRGNRLITECNEGQPFMFDCGSFGATCANGACRDVPQGVECFWDFFECAAGLECNGMVCWPSNTACTGAEPYCQGTALHFCQNGMVGLIDCAQIDPARGGACGAGPGGSAGCMLPPGANCLTGAPFGDGGTITPWQCQGSEPGCVESRGAVACTEQTGSCTLGDVRTCRGDRLITACNDGQPFMFDCASFGATCSNGACRNVPQGVECFWDFFECAPGLACNGMVCWPHPDGGPPEPSDAGQPADELRIGGDERPPFNRDASSLDAGFDPGSIDSGSIPNGDAETDRDSSAVSPLDTGTDADSGPPSLDSGIDSGRIPNGEAGSDRDSGPVSPLDAGIEPPDQRCGCAGVETRSASIPKSVAMLILLAAAIPALRRRKSHGRVRRG